MVNFKTITQNNTGTAIKFGGDDLDKTHNFLNGAVGYEPVTIRSLFGVEDGKFYIEDPSTGYRCYIRTGSITIDQDWLLPVGEGEVVNNIKNIFVNEQVFQKWINFKKISPPPDPDTNHLTLWADSATGQIMVKDHTGVAQTIFACIGAIENLGSTGVPIYDSKVGSTVYLRSITSLANAITVTSNETTNSVDLNIVPSNLLLETLGGTLLSSQVPVLGTANLPAAVVLDTEDSTFTGVNKFDKELTLKQLTAHPTAPAGYVTLYARDDNNMYYKNASGSLFKLLYNTDLDDQVPLPTEGKLTGYWDGTGVQGTGLLNDMYSQEDIARTNYHDLTTGKFGQEWGSDTDDATCGLASNKRNIVYRDANPKLWVKFGVDVADVSNQTQIYIGWVSDTSEGLYDDDNPLDGINGFMLGKRSTDTNFQIIRNDGSSTQTVDNTGSLPAPDTGIHTLYIEGDNDNDRWGMGWDGGPITWKTNNDPIEEKLLGFVAFITPEGASTAIRKLRLLDITVIRNIK